MHLLPFILIPLCSILNHLGGQSVTIPFPRITCRVFGIGLAFLFASIGTPLHQALIAWAIVTAGMALWAVFHWGDGFMSVTGIDTRNYSKYRWICWICDRLCGVSYLTTLTPAQCKAWGMVYMTVRGTFMYPMFIAMGWYISPWAYVIGIGCLFQGLVYRTSPLVRVAEYRMGALIGLLQALTAIL